MISVPHCGTHVTETGSVPIFLLPGYAGNPLRAHEPSHARTPFSDTHFERWLELFTGTVDEHFAGPTAEMAKQRAAKMAHTLRRLLAGEHDDASTPTEPLWPTSRGT